MCFRVCKRTSLNSEVLMQIFWKLRKQVNEENNELKKSYCNVYLLRQQFPNWLALFLNLLSIQTRKKSVIAGIEFKNRKDWLAKQCFHDVFSNIKQRYFNREIEKVGHIKRPWNVINKITNKRSKTTKNTLYRNRSTNSHRSSRQSWKNERLLQYHRGKLNENT